VERTASVYDKGRLLAVVEQLSAREVQMVTLYAESLGAQRVSDTGRSYIEMLLQEGVDGAGMLAAVQAIRDVDSRLAREVDFQAGLDDLHRRTEEHFHSWCRERGVDYEALSEEDFTELVEEATRRMREGR